MEQKKVAYLGPEGTFGWYVAENSSHTEIIPYNSHAKVIQAVVDGKAEKGFVARENSIGGSVVDAIDPLIAGSIGIRIYLDGNSKEVVYSPMSAMTCGESVLPIVQCLYGRPVRKNEIKRIYSHPQGLAQCEEYIAKRFPQAQLVSVGSTVGGVEKILEDDEAVAIAPPWAKYFYSGVILMEEGVQDRKDNTTRFLAIGKEDCRPTGNDKTSIYFQVPGDERPGSLVRVLQILAAVDINMRLIESRPTKTQLGRYGFIADIDGHRNDCAIRRTLEFIVGVKIVTMLKVLGSYPRWRNGV
ncbi:MAG: prephenate dehydratase domain-containing protein [Candidatus Nealsonbacteria bacterium]